MDNPVETRIKLHPEVHRQVKAACAYYGINLAEGLGMCVAFVCSVTDPLRWTDNLPRVYRDMRKWLDDNELPV